MRGLALLNLSFARRASALLAGVLSLFVLAHSAAASAYVWQPGVPRAPDASGRDGVCDLSATWPLPLSEAFHQDSPTQTNVESTGWKSWVLPSTLGPTAVGLLSGGLARSGVPALPVSSRSLQVLFCTWQV